MIDSPETDFENFKKDILKGPRGWIPDVCYSICNSSKPYFDD